MYVFWLYTRLGSWSFTCSLVLSRVFISLLLHSHTRLRIAACKKLATVRAPRRRPFRKKYTNQCINNVRQTFARLLVFNKNVFFCKNDFKNRKQSSRQRTVSGTKLCQIDTLGRHSAFHRSGHSQSKSKAKQRSFLRRRRLSLYALEIT